MNKKLYYVGNYKGYIAIYAKNERGARQIASRMVNSSLESMKSYYNKLLFDDFD